MLKPPFRRIFYLLGPQGRRETVFLILMILLSGIVEMANVASIVPFLSLVGAPDMVNHPGWLSRLYHWTGASNPRMFFMLSGSAVLFLLVLSNFILSWSTWLIIKFTYFQSHSLSKKLFTRYLAQPYRFYLTRNSLDLSRHIFEEVPRAIVGTMIPSFLILARGFVALCIFGLIVWANPVMALGIMGVLSLVYGLFFIHVRRAISREAVVGDKARQDRFRAVTEALGGIKEVKVLGREALCIQAFDSPSLDLSRSDAENQMRSLLPRYVFETVAFGGAVLIIVMLSGLKHDMAHLLPLLALYAFGGYRLMPAIQQIFSNYTYLAYHSASLNLLINSWNEALEDEKILQSPPELAFQDSVRLDQVVFQYPAAREPSLKGVSIHIQKNQKIGLAGPTGSGKTTAVDVLLGLLSPQQGHLFVDNVAITEENSRSWQRLVGYVPQQVYLIDDTVARNIAFQEGSGPIDRNRLVQAARVAQIHDFIEKDLPQGYETIVGERGVRLSGGERQRLGIARALYRNPPVLVLDEATSALDTVTEQSLIDAIDSFAENKTLVLIAHRLSTLKVCDRILVFEKGQVVADGTYDALFNSSPLFRTMATQQGKSLS